MAQQLKGKTEVFIMMYTFEPLCHCAFAPIKIGTVFALTKRKYHMKKTFFFLLLTLSVIYLNAQTNKLDKPQTSEQNNTASQNVTTTGKLTNSSRLFASKDDLTSVIVIIPADSVVTVLDSDSTYLHVVYDDNEGYIFNRHVILKRIQVQNQQPFQAQSSDRQTEPVADQQQTRYSYLENKYGTNMASRLITGKIWKGMNSDMVKDSWGMAEKINRIISGNVVKEEWIFKNTWLYFENNTLLEWGPVKK